MHDMIERNIIAIYESLFSDRIMIEILFRYSDTPPSPEPSSQPFSARRSLTELFRPLRHTMEQFHQRFKGGCNDQ